MLECVYCNKKLGKQYYTITIHSISANICNHCKFLFEIFFGERRQDNYATLERIFYSLSLTSNSSRIYFEKVSRK